MAASKLRLGRSRFVSKGILSTTLGAGVFVTLAVLLSMSLVDIDAGSGSDFEPESESASENNASGDILIFPLPEKHYEPTLNITGLAWPDQRLNIELNKQVVAQTRANGSGDFAVRISLHPGINRIRIVEDGETERGSQSEIFLVRYKPLPVSSRPTVAASSSEASIQATVAAPVLDTPAAVADSNPVTVTGSAPADSPVTFFVNGRETRSVAIDASGLIDAWVPLEDGSNSIYAVASSGQDQSPASNTITTDYTNDLPRQYSGTLTTDTVWTVGDGTPYELTADFTVASGATLWVQSDVLVEISGNYLLAVEGALVVQGTEAAPVIWRPATTACDGVATQRNDWDGIRVRSGGIASINYAEIHCAGTGVSFSHGDGEIHHSRFLNNFFGIIMLGASADSSINPQITKENEITGSFNGIAISLFSAPLISGANLITGNDIGVYVGGSFFMVDSTVTEDPTADPAPVVRGNALYGNATYNYQAESFASPAGATALNASGNWWGTTDVVQIAAGIYDNQDDSQSPVVDFRPYLDAEDGDPVFDGEVLSGPIATDTTLAARTSNQLAGDVTVAAGATLTIEAGALIEIDGNYRLDVDGTLVMQGTESAPVIWRPAVIGCDGVATGRNDWGGIQVRSGGIASIDYAEIHCAGTGIDFNLGDGQVHHSRFLNNETGIRMIGASAGSSISPQITDSNEISGNNLGIDIRRYSTPLISGGNVITNNDTGVLVVGDSDSTADPVPVVSGNALYGNTTYNYEARNFANSAAIVLDATANWWGSADIVQIAAGIYDNQDDAQSPVVDFSPYLNSENGSLVLDGAVLTGPITTDTILGAGSPHQLTGDVTVTVGTELTIQAGALIEIDGNFALNVDGTLMVQGSESAPVVWRPTAAGCDGVATEREDWVGILVNLDGVAAIDYAEIHCASIGVHFNSGDGEIHHSWFLNNETGIRMIGASAGSNISPQITESNEITGSNRGIDVRRYSTPLISGDNVITGNNTGVLVVGESDSIADPAPVVSGNALYGNATYNYEVLNYANAAAIVLDATANWWGSTDAVQISAGIYDNQDDAQSPVVDFSPYLDSEDGALVFDGGVLPGLIATNMILTAGSSSQLAGDVTVAAGATLTIEAGALIEIDGSFLFDVDGTLVVQGSQAAPVVWRPIAVGCDGVATQRSDWSGIRVNRDGVVIIDYAEIHCADVGVDFRGDGEIHNSRFLNNATGISMTGLSTNIVSPQITEGNEITGSNRGIQVLWFSAPLISGGNLITGNDVGVYVSGTRSSAADPAPVVSGNALYGNATYNYQARNFASPASATTLDATGNWWGTTDVVQVVAGVLDNRDSVSSPVVDFGGYLDSDGGDPAFDGDVLSGPIRTDTILATGTSILLAGSVNVWTGATLTVEAGAQIEVVGDFNIDIRGTLLVQGTELEPVVFRPAAAGCDGVATQRSDWGGIEVSGNGVALIDYAEIHCADIGVNFNRGDGEIHHSRLLNNLTGISMIGTSFQTRISPKITGENEITGSNWGILVSAASDPLISGGNVLTGNGYGIYVTGEFGSDPDPEVNGSALYGNELYNYYSNNYTSFATLDATGNWWGTTDAIQIAAGIYDRQDSSQSPHVDFNGYLDSEGGNPAFDGEVLTVPITADTILAAGTSNQLARNVRVNGGTTLTIEAGAQVEIAGDFTLEVNGTLVVQGSELEPVVFRPVAAGCDGAAIQRNDWGGIQVTANVTGDGVALIDYAEIHCAGIGVDFHYGDGEIHHSKFLNNLTGVSMIGRSSASISPQITGGNEFTGNVYGIRVRASSTPLISGGNVMVGNQYGVYVSGALSSAPDPDPVITGNALYGNTSYNYHSSDFVSPAGATTLDATGNWWGTTDVSQIVAGIYDNQDSPGSPVVDFNGYLGSEGGDPAFDGELLLAPVMSDTILAAGTLNQLVRDLTVAPGVTLTVEAGAQIEIAGNFALNIDGMLAVQGSESAPVIWRPTAAGCDGVATQRSDWSGIRVRSGGIVSIDYAEIHCADIGVNFDRGDGEIHRSRFLNNLTGIRMVGTPSAPISPQIIDRNEITGSNSGIDVQPRSSPLISGGNIITGNAHGISVRGSTLNSSNNPAPVVTGNALYGNTTYNYQAIAFASASSVILDATGNWWGTADVIQIGDGIYDNSDFSGSPVVDFNGYLGSEGGDPAFDGEVLTAPITVDTVLAASVSYQLVRDLTITDGVTLMIEAGVHFEIAGDFSLDVDGTLVVQGTEVAPVVFRPSATGCDDVAIQREDWDGIRVRQGGIATIDYAEIHCASIGVGFFGGDGEIHHSRFLNNETGIRMIAASADNSISPRITEGNEISGSIRGIQVLQFTEPLISDGNVITGNNTGVYVAGSNSAVADPVPVVTGNALFGNVRYNYEARNFADAGTTALDATGNWWGTTDVNQIAAGIFDNQDNSSSPMVNFDGYLSSADGLTVLLITDASMTLAVFEPLNDEVAEGIYNLNGPATVILQIRRAEDNVLVSETVQSHETRGEYQFTWDGKSTQGNIVAPGAYRAVLIVSDGTNQSTYKRPLRGLDLSPPSQVATSYAPFRNQHYKNQISLSDEGFVRMQILPSVGESFWVFEDVYYPPGANWIYWDGRDPTGEILNQPVSVVVQSNNMGTTSIWVEGTAPKIIGLDTVPNIEVKSDPYLIWHSYEQISHIAYQIDLDSHVTAKILPPGIHDPQHASAIVIADRVSQQAFDLEGEAITHSLEWKGYNDGSPNQILTGAEGAFTFILEAESQETGNTSVYRGVLNIRR
ncbi:MAG: FlgD immunoglobulin-like domain containing protein [Wenzhouxiangellaceae bacterium]